MAYVTPSAAASYRTAITSADVLALPGTVTCTKLTGVGSATAGTYTVFVVAGNAYGRTTPKQGNTTVVTETTNLGVRAAFAAVTGADYYDVYCSTDGAAAKFVGRVTEAQRASGIILTAVNVTGPGGTAGAVDVYVPGTGLANNAIVTNTAYTPESLTAIAPTSEYLDVGVKLTRSGDSVAPTVTLIPFYLGASGHYMAGVPITLTFGGTTTAYDALYQSTRLTTRGRATAVVVANIAGTGASIDLEAVTS